MPILLKERRNELGRELKEIAELTRIKCAYLKSIEEDEFEKLPVEVYTRGYIKEYAQFLGIPADIALEPYEKYLREKKGIKEKDTSHEKETPTLSKEALEGLEAFKDHDGPEGLDKLISPEVKTFPSIKSAPVKMLWILPLIAIIAGIYFLMPAMNSAPPPLPQRSVQPAPVPQTTPPAVSQSPQAPSIPSPVAADNIVTKGSKIPEAVKAQEKPAIPKDAIIDTKDKKTDNSAAAKKKHTLRIDATDKVWIKVVIDGKAIRETLLYQGDKTNYGANKSFSLIVGNAAGAKILFDGKSYENLGMEGQVVRLDFPAPAQPSAPQSPPQEPDKPER
jgi:cytoskeleton protein RodZ